MIIDERGLNAAAIALANIHQYNGQNEETDADARRIIEAYEEAKFRNIELPKRPWFAAEFDFHRAMGMGKNTDDALWESIQTYQGMIQQKAALWRPIEEASQDCKVLICLTDCDSAVWIATRANGSEWHFEDSDLEADFSHEELIERNAMFRPIDPPPKR